MIETMYTANHFASIIDVVLAENEIIYEVEYDPTNLPNLIVYIFPENDWFLPDIYLHEEYVQFGENGEKIKYVDLDDDKMKQIMEAFCQNADEFVETITKLGF